MDLKALFGQNLKKLRSERGLTQECLAESLELNSRQISKIETGEHLPSAKTLEKLCEVLNVLPQELFTFDREKTKSVSKELLLIRQVEKLIKDEEYYDYINLAIKAIKDEKSLNNLMLTLNGMKLTMRT